MNHFVCALRAGICRGSSQSVLPGGVSNQRRFRDSLVKSPVTLCLRFEARDENENIARGTHKLRVIEAARLARKVQRKAR